MKDVSLSGDDPCDNRQTNDKSPTTSPQWQKKPYF